MNIESIQTRLFKNCDDLIEFLIENLKDRELEARALAITSKIVSLAEKCTSRKTVDKSELIKKEADIYLGPAAYDCHLTIKHGLLIPNSGIDESNSQDGDYILFPQKPNQSARMIGMTLKEHFGLKNFGVLLTDSRTLPLRRGVIGACLGHWGFQAVLTRIGEKDLFGRPSKFTHINVADAVSAAAVLEMGELGEQRPLSLISSNLLKFLENPTFSENENGTQLQIPPAEDLFQPLFESFLQT